MEDMQKLFILMDMKPGMDIWRNHLISKITSIWIAMAICQIEYK